MMNCPSCAANNSETSRSCSQCGAVLKPETVVGSTRGIGTSPADGSAESSLPDIPHDERRKAAAYEQTVVYSPVKDSTTGNRQHAGNVELVAGNVPKPQCRDRIRAATAASGSDSGFVSGPCRFLRFLFLGGHPSLSGADFPERLSCVRRGLPGGLHWCALR